MCACQLVMMDSGAYGSCDNAEAEKVKENKSNAKSIMDISVLKSGMNILYIVLRSIFLSRWY